ncbi:MAG: class I SAM-dependent rRNA methyltransferase [Chloroflexi bacterium]|nr:class I SAM-dependent rRNA methyltransferase [Chloroflexota bacterium]
MPPDIQILTSPNWKDYELLDSGAGLKLERFGPYRFIRPEVQALWSRGLPSRMWDSADAVFVPSGEESGGHWKYRKTTIEKWEMSYPLSPSPSITANLQFTAMTTPGRHLGVFPECAVHWDWMAGLLQKRHGMVNEPARILNLFGYTGIATLAAAAMGAVVTHVDASKKSITWARQNQSLSRLEDRSVRWILDDAVKFVQREARRNIRYDGILLDPPKFGRGPKGEVWEVYKNLPDLLHACREILSDHPMFVILTVYAVKVSALHLLYLMEEKMRGLAGAVECGELVTDETSKQRLLSHAVFGRWKSGSI